MPTWRAVPLKACAFLRFLLVVRCHLLAIHSNVFLLIWNKDYCKGKRKNCDVINFCQKKQVVEKGLIVGFLCFILTDTPQLVLLFCLSSRNTACMSTSPCQRLTEEKVVSLATAFEMQGGNCPVSPTCRLEPSLCKPAAVFCL